MRARLASAVFAIVAVIIGMFMAAQPAQAASGGGCRDNNGVNSCISFNRDTLVGDFYVNRAVDFSVCYAIAEINKNGVVVASKRFNFNGVGGHYGNVTNYAITIPPSSGWAFTAVKIYRCDGAFHYRADSWRVYYP